MSKVEMLSSDNHSELKVESAIDTKFEDIGATAAVLAEELPKLALDFPVFITKNPETGQFELSAVMGFEPAENLFFHEGEWRAGYVPLDLRRRPFQALLLQGNSAGDGEKQLKVGINVESKRLTEEGEALFNSDGTSTKYLEGISSILGSLMTGSQLNQAFLASLAERGLIESVNLSVQNPSGEQISVGGLYTVSSEKLAELSDEDALSFHKLGYLQACYAMIHSLGHMEKLFEWKNQQLA